MSVPKHGHGFAARIRDIKSRIVAIVIRQNRKTKGTRPTGSRLNRSLARRRWLRLAVRRRASKRVRPYAKGRTRGDSLPLATPLPMLRFAPIVRFATSLPLVGNADDPPGRTREFLVRRRLLRIDSADERRSPSDRMRLVGRAPRSPVLHGLALRTRRSGIFLRLLRARSSPHWFARLLARLVRTAVARTPSARPLRSARRTGRLLAPLVCSRLARARSARSHGGCSNSLGSPASLCSPNRSSSRTARLLTPRSVPLLLRRRFRARSLPSLLVHPADFALLARRVPRRLVVRSAARCHETGAGHASHWRPSVSAVRFSAS